MIEAKNKSKAQPNNGQVLKELMTMYFILYMYICMYVISSYIICTAAGDVVFKKRSGGELQLKRATFRQALQLTEFKV